MACWPSNAENVGLGCSLHKLNTFCYLTSSLNFSFMHICLDYMILVHEWPTAPKTLDDRAAILAAVGCMCTPVTTSSTLILTPPPIHVWPYQFFLQLTLSLPVWVDNWMTLYRHGAINRKETTWCHYLGRGPEARIYNSIGSRSSWVTQHIVFTQALHKCW